MYPFLTLEDETEIVHSEFRPDRTVRVYIERPDDRDCFHHAWCTLPGYRWEDVYGFTDEEIQEFQKILESTAHLIIRFAKEGGFENATAV